MVLMRSDLWYEFINLSPFPLTLQQAVADPERRVWRWRHEEVVVSAMTCGGCCGGVREEIEATNDEFSTRSSFFALPSLVAPPRPRPRHPLFVGSPCFY